MTPAPIPGPRPLTVLICGGRNLDAEKVATWLHWNARRSVGFNYGATIDKVITGDQTGADTGGNLYAIRNKIPLQRFPALWKMEPDPGPRRNKRMIVQGLPDLVIAFPGGPGTANMIEQARSHGLPIYEVKGNFL